MCHIAHGHDNGEPDVQLACKVDQACAKRTGLRQKCHASDGRRLGENGRAQAHAGRSVCNAHAVRANYAHIVFVYNAHQFFFTGRAFRTDFTESGGNADKRRNALLAAGLRNIQNARRGNGENAEVYVAGNFPHIRITGYAQNVLAFAVDGEDLAAIAHVQQIFYDCVADAGAVGCTDHGHALRV